MSIRESVQHLIALVEQGNFLEAIETYYAEDATMQENGDAPRVGLPALLANERKALEAVQTWHVKHAESYIVDGDRSAIHWLFDMSDASGRHRTFDEIAWQEWRDGKIVRERFFYDRLRKPA